MKYSTVILTRNERPHIEACIENVRLVSAEILVVDDYSEDGTPDIAEDLGAIVLQRPLNGDWAAQRNFALENVREQHTLMIDADERLDETALETLIHLQCPSGKAGAILRRNFYKKKELRNGRFAGDWQTKIIHSSVRYDPKRPVHEKPMVIDDEVVRIPGAIEHYTYASMRELFGKMRTYGEIEGRHNQGEVSLGLRALVAPRLARVSLKQACKNGLPGLITVAADIYGDLSAVRALQRAPGINAPVEKVDPGMALTHIN